MTSENETLRKAENPPPEKLLNQLRKMYEDAGLKVPHKLYPKTDKVSQECSEDDSVVSDPLLDAKARL